MLSLLCLICEDISKITSLTDVRPFRLGVRAGWNAGYAEHGRMYYMCILIACRLLADQLADPLADRCD
jgi:hypothetical protein